jgi:hypothetical protein
MIIQELRAEFNEYFQSPDAEIILWLDPQSQWKGVIEHLKKDFRLVEYNGSQLEVKADPIEVLFVTLIISSYLAKGGNAPGWRS